MPKPQKHMMNKPEVPCAACGSIPQDDRWIIVQYRWCGGYQSRVVHYTEECMRTLREKVQAAREAKEKEETEEVIQ